MLKNDWYVDEELARQYEEEGIAMGFEKAAEYALEFELEWRDSESIFLILCLQNLIRKNEKIFRFSNLYIHDPGHICPASV